MIKLNKNVNKNYLIRKYDLIFAYKKYISKNINLY